MVAHQQYGICGRKNDENLALLEYYEAADSAECKFNLIGFYEACPYDALGVRGASDGPRSR